MLNACRLCFVARSPRHRLCRGGGGGGGKNAQLPCKPPLRWGPGAQRDGQLQRVSRTVAAPKLSVLTALLHESEEVIQSAGIGGDNIANSALATSPASKTTRYISSVSNSFLQPSLFEKELQEHRRAFTPAVPLHAHSAHNSPPSPQREVEVGPMASSMAERTAQQSALRDAFNYADKHHRLRMRKDKSVYTAEVKAFRAAHNGRMPSEKEVSRYTDVSLPPVAALNAFAHLDSRTSSMHKDVQDGLLLWQSITRSELLKTNERALVRCLSCFHVYGARPRELWGGEDGSAHGGSSQQSWIALEREQKRAADAEAMMKRPGLRKHRYSVGRRRQRAASSPVACPMCGSPRAQWAVEYIHYRTHAR